MELGGEKTIKEEEREKENPKTVPCVSVIQSVYKAVYGIYKEVT